MYYTAGASERAVISKQYGKEEKYWLDIFADNPVKAHFPYDYKKDGRAPGAGSAVFEITGKTFSRLMRLSKASDHNLHLVLSACLFILLEKYTGSRDLVIGIPVLRQAVGSEFINTVLPIRSCYADGISFKEFLVRIRQTIIEAVRNQNYPIDVLVEQLGISLRPGSYFPLFDAAILVTNIHDRKYLAHINIGTVFSFSRGEEDIEGIIEYNSYLFKKSTIERIIVHFENLLNQLLLNPGADVSTVDVLSGEERHQLIYEFNETQAGYPQNKNLHQLFGEQAARTPGHTAVIGREQLTYGELNRKSDQLAYVLMEKGVAAEDIVALMVERSIGMIVGILGILKAGGAYLPIDPEYPQERIDYMLKDSGAKMLLTELPEGRSFHHSSIIVHHSNNLAYIIYTSGTTGRPKGVMIEHINVVRLFFNDRCLFDFNESDTWTMFHSYCFDFSVWEMYGALLYGGKLIIVPKIVSQDPRAFLAVLKKNRVTVLNQTPPAFYNLINEELRGSEQDLCLRYVIFGGEALAPIKLKEWQERYPGIKLINMFGITETTVHVTYKEITHREIEANISSIGMPIPTLSAYLFDPGLRPVPIGAEGELCVGGLGVGRGYLNKPGLTRKKFIGNPWKQGERLYKSGDLARLGEDGEMVYLGRKDRQVQIRGFRIELGEIESQLLRYEEIKEAVVIAKEGKDNMPSLCAYIVTGVQPAVSTLRDFLSKKLPGYMIPAYFVRVPQIPLTSNGKIDKKKLPKPEVISGEEYAAPADRLEEQLVEIWKEILELEELGVNNNFFNTGGDSIKAIRLVSLVNNRLNTNLKVLDIFTNETIRALSRFMKRETTVPCDEDKELQEVRKEIEELRERVLKTGKLPGDIEFVFPMSDIEKGMIFHTYRETDEAVYHDQFVYQRTYGSFDPDILRRALELMTEKHPILRTGYNVDDFESFVHLIHKEVRVRYTHVDLTGSDNRRQEQCIKEYMQKDRQDRWDITSPPLWRMATFDLGNRNICAVWTFHHAILDGWSNASLMTELNNAYVRLKSDKDYIPGKLDITYEGFILDEMAEKKKNRNIDFWREELANYKRISFPDLKNENRSNEIHNLPRHYGIEVFETLRGTSKKYNISLKNLCFAAYVFMMNMLTYENDVAVGLVSNNRPERKDGDKLLGCFLNTLPFRLKIPGSITWKDYLKLVHKKLIEVNKYGKITFYEIVKIIGERNRAENPIFDTIFNYVDFHIYNQAVQEIQQMESGSGVLVQGYERTNTLFDFHINISPRGLKIGLIYSTSIISDKMVERLIGYFENILDLMISRGECSIRKDDVISDEERQGLLIEFNDTEAEYPRDKPLQQLFGEQAARTPGKIALVGGRQPAGGKGAAPPAIKGAGSVEQVQITYRHLNEKSGQLAQLLRQKGVGPDVIVGIMVERSVEMITGIFGILKAGGAYLPIDPGYPQERIDYMLKDSNARVLLKKSEIAQRPISKFETNPNDRNSNDQNEISTLTVLNFEHLDFEFASDFEFRASNFRPLGLAYVIYTSGSTGRPKGVMIEHNPVVNRVKWMQKRYPLQESDTILQKTPVTFDVSVWELFWWALEGASLCLLPPGREKEPEAIVNAVKNHRVTVVHFVPSMLNAFLEYVEVSGSMAKLPGLRQVFSSGEALTLQQVETFAELLYKRHNTKLANLYGPTEATVDVSYFDCTAGEDLERVPIGKPIDNIRLFILCKEKHLQPVGIPGELCIAGVGLARGYLNKPELTAKKFINFSINTRHVTRNTRLYRTGDLARWLPDGNIEFLGRIDHQVKIRGFRIELGEIESRLLKHEGIKDAVVVMKQDEGRERFLCAYIVSDAEFNVPQLKGYLAKQLPDYMCPSEFIKIDKIPLLPNGKLDGKTLDSSGKRLTTGKKYVPPKNKIEKITAGVWKEMLHLDNIGVHDNFFDLGGDSMLIMKVVGKIGKIFQAGIPVIAMFKYPTIHSFSNYLSEEKNKPAVDNEPQRLAEMEETMKETVRLFDTI